MNQKNRKKSSGFGGWAVIAAVILMFNLIGKVSDGELPEEVAIAAAPLIFVIAAIVLVVKIAGKSAVRKAAAPVRAQSVREKPQPSIRLHSTHPAVSRTGNSAPEPYCLVCDQTGEDHFARDRAQRIAQLDEWLKNGLIDKEEYRALKQRYTEDR